MVVAIVPVEISPFPFPILAYAVHLVTNWAVLFPWRCVAPLARLSCNSGSHCQVVVVLYLDRNLEAGEDRRVEVEQEHVEEAYVDVEGDINVNLGKTGQVGERDKVDMVDTVGVVHKDLTAAVGVVAGSSRAAHSKPLQRNPLQHCKVLPQAAAAAGSAAVAPRSFLQRPPNPGVSFLCIWCCSFLLSLCLSLFKSFI